MIDKIRILKDVLGISPRWVIEVQLHEKDENGRYKGVTDTCSPNHNDMLRVLTNLLNKVLDL